jgi:uncharacterized membrane protein YphA (DoxX/SURF4 family)
MKKLTLIGRILFAVPFGILGLNHFFMTDFYLGMLTSFIPGMGFSIFLVGLALIAASICIIINKYVVIACISLASLLFLFIVTIHIPGLFIPDKSTIAMIELMKDTALLGGALLIASLNSPNEIK